jgi:NADH:ubiquinone oxidoreductase subunit 5 (subunit L)/multisubunit Na+/H+ antiporter MnhA subunit
VAIISVICASFSTIIQQDNKRLIAYSSVAHMAVVVLGLFSNNLQGIEGAILLAIGHGFTSPGLFICVGGILFDRAKTRIINYIRGLASYMPVFTILFFIFTLCNTGIPLSINWLGEFLSLMGIWKQNPIIACLGATGIVLSACYSMLLYNRLSYGNLSPYLSPLKDLNRREYFLLVTLLLPIVIFGILPNNLLDSLHMSTTALIYEFPENQSYNLLPPFLPQILNRFKSLWLWVKKLKFLLIFFLISPIFRATIVLVLYLFGGSLDVHMEVVVNSIIPCFGYKRFKSKLKPLLPFVYLISLLLFIYLIAYFLPLHLQLFLITKLSLKVVVLFSIIVVKVLFSLLVRLEKKSNSTLAHPIKNWKYFK